MIGELTNHVWQSTLFAVAAGLLTVAFRKNRAKIRYWLWFSASAKFFVPFSLLMSLGSHWQWAPAAKEIAAQAVSVAMVQITQPFPDTVWLAPSMPRTTDWSPLAIFAVWACGFLGVALTRFRDWVRIRAAVRSSTPIDIPATVEVRSARGLLEPGVAGVVRPILFLPAGIAERLTPPQLEAVLAHELCHVRRRDNLFASIHMIVEAVFWFHPLVWWIGARLVEERERACDEEVLLLGNEPHVYAEGILNVSKLYVESPLACVSGVTGSNLKKRIEAIMINRLVLRLNFTKKAALVAATMAALAVPIIIGMMNAPSTRAQSAAAATPKFEVVSIRPCQSEDPIGTGGRKGGGRGVQKRGGGGPNSSPDRLTTGCVTVADHIRSAYVSYEKGYLNRDPSNVSAPLEGGPAWTRSDRYQINAKAEGSPGKGMMSGPMMQALLEERFKLRIHRETREVPVYALTVAKSGPNLSPFQEGSCTPLDLGRVAQTWEDNACRVMVGQKGPLMTLEGPGTSLGDISKLLFLIVDRPVIDKTGIQGRFDIHLEFAHQVSPALFHDGGEPPGPPAADPDERAGPSIFSVIEKRLGLKLEPAKGPREFLVIDRIERPTEN